MSTSIFIKTWENDLEWLQFSLKSILKHASGIDEIIIAADASCVSHVYPMAGPARVISVPDWENGYIQQQWVKLNAHHYTNSDYILYVDSDCVFKTAFSPESFMRDGKPILLKTKYELVGDGAIWKPITENFVGWAVEYEYMRRLPWMYKCSSLANFHHYFDDLEYTLKSMVDRSFSEFNALGAYIDKFESDEYYISDTDDWVPEAVSQQFWSWGGVTPEIRETILRHIYESA